MRYLVLLLLSVAFSVAVPAAENDDASPGSQQPNGAETTADGAGSGQSGSGNGNGQDDGEQSAGQQPSPADRPIGEADNEDGPSRFVPSEEISLDLGVSFPVDI